MACIFLLEDNNEIIASRREVIMQRSKLMDEIWFLVNPVYKTIENDMSVCNVILEYILPVSKSYHSLELVKEDEGYEEYLKYVVPLDTNLSAEAGDIELQLTFIYVGLDADGNGIQKVRKTKTTKLHITPIAAWGDIIPDSALSSIDQRIIETQLQINALEQYIEEANRKQVDNLVYSYDTDALQLMAGDEEIGGKVFVRDMIDNSMLDEDYECNGRVIEF